MEEEKMRSRDLLKAFFGLMSAGETVASPDTEAVLTERIGAIDDRISLQLNEVFHHPEFQRLEASWRGLHYLISNSPESDMVRIEALSVSKKDLLRDLQRAPEFDQSGLFNKVFDERYGTYGGFPFSALIADYEFDKTPQDVELLERLSQVAAASYCPLIAAAGPGLFNLDSFTELSRPRQLSKIFDSSEYAKWKSFRASEDSRYVGLVMPRVLMRLPYGRAGISTEDFGFDERVDLSEHEHYLWGTAVWAFAVRLAQAFHRYGWCASFIGPERGGTAPNLPVQEFLNDEGEPVVKCPAEIAITDRRRGELEKLGLIPLSYRLGSNEAAFFAAPSCKKPAEYANSADTEKARAAARLEYIFAASRIVQYLQCIVRDRERSFLTRAEWEAYLRSWLNRYVVLDDEPAEKIKAKYPLRAAGIQMTEMAGCPGKFSAAVKLMPHFQLNRQEVELRATLELGGGDETVGR